MKRVISILFIVVLCLGMWACSPAEDKGTDSVNALKEPADETENEPEILSSQDLMPEFSVSDLEGNTVTNDIFTQADLTVVNFWATYCNPCINEMPELGKWAEEMPEQVQIIGIIVDAGSAETDEAVMARQIVEMTGADYPQLIAAAEFDDIMQTIVGVPTTFFVDKTGNIVMDPIIGADVDGYKRSVEEYLNGQE